jgi:hypothetical protein
MRISIIETSLIIQYLPLIFYVFLSILLVIFFKFLQTNYNIKIIKKDLNFGQSPNIYKYEILREKRKKFFKILLKISILLIFILAILDMVGIKLFEQSKPDNSIF